LTGQLRATADLTYDSHQARKYHEPVGD